MPLLLLILFNKTVLAVETKECEMTQFVEIKDHKLTNYQLENFKFYVDEKQLRFSEDSIMYNLMPSPMQIDAYGNEHAFMASNPNISHLKYMLGNFYFQYSDYGESYSVSAECNFP